MSSCNLARYALRYSCCLDAVSLFSFMLYLTIWGVGPIVTHQTSWLESTGVCGVQQIKLVGGLYVMQSGYSALCLCI